MSGITEKQRQVLGPGDFVDEACEAGEKKKDCEKKGQVISG
jgi:hypothetical protein